MGAPTAGAAVPFFSDAPSTSRTVLPQAVEINRNCIFMHFSESKPEAVIIADRALTTLFQARAELLENLGRGPGQSFTAMSSRLGKTPGKVDSESGQTRLGNAQKLALEIVTLARGKLDGGQPNEALTVLNDSIREILNTRSVGAGHLGQYKDMWQGFRLVHEIDPKFPKVLYNLASKQARFYPKLEAGLEIAIRQIEAAITGAAAYGIAGRMLLGQAREGDGDFAALRNHPTLGPKFFAALERAEKTLPPAA